MSIEKGLNKTSSHISLNSPSNFLNTQSFAKSKEKSNYPDYIKLGIENIEKAALA